MTVTLGGLVLSDELILSGLETAKNVVVSQRRSLAGRSITRIDPAPGGRTLTLSGENHFTLGQITAIKELAATCQAVTLVHHRGTYHVKIIDTPVVPAIDYANPSDDEWYSGEITMIEV